MNLRRSFTGFKPVAKLIGSQTLLAALTLTSAAFFAPRAAAQQHAPAATQSGPAPQLSDQDVAATQSQLIKLLRLSPTLTSVVARDPSLLSNQEYVEHNNPQLGAFLTQHPEVARNPDFYLFTHLNHSDGSPDEALERAVWPDVFHNSPPRSGFDEFLSNMPPFLAFAAFLVAVAWMTRIFLENRRWNRIYKLQSEVHSRIIEKFGTNQELAAYMETDAGRKFLEASPIAVNIEPSQRVPNVVARVLTPLQLGVVLVLLGIGFLLLRHVQADMEVPMLVLGTVTLMPGIGFILSAGLTWLLASRLGLMPGNDQQPSHMLTRDRM
ncbi:MAG: hypothetical protein KGN79_11490 [Acidobacteriota bacterium]|nr:hypothetical protein [Acidobacteriota bacterium]